MGMIYQSNIVVLILKRLKMSMTDLEYFLNKELLLPLKIPSIWLISKNYLYDVNCNWLNQLNGDDKFKMSEIYLYKNIFYANLERNINNSIYNFVINFLVYPEIENDEYKKFEYEIGLGLYEVAKKNKLIFMRNCSFYNILDVRDLLNLILIDVYHKLDELINEDNILKNVKEWI